MTTITKKPSKALLKKTQKILQKSHDTIEAIGFDIEKYGDLDNYKRLIGPACIIGTTRAMCGIDPNPCVSAAAAYGPELPLVLEYLDKAALKTKIGKETSKKRKFVEYDDAGSIAEHIGLNNAATKRWGLTVFRIALRMVAKDLEN